MAFDGWVGRGGGLSMMWSRVAMILRFRASAHRTCGHVIMNKGKVSEDIVTQAVGSDWVHKNHTCHA